MYNFDRFRDTVSINHVGQEEALAMKHCRLLLTLVLLLLSACHPKSKNLSLSAPQLPSSIQIKETMTHIIEQQEKDTLNWLSKEDVQWLLQLDPSFIEECYLSYGLDDLKMSDLFIIKPTKGQKKKIVNAYKLHQQNRMTESLLNEDEGNFDKAQNALIYEHGDYLIFLLLNHPLQAQAEINEILDLKQNSLSMASYTYEKPTSFAFSMYFLTNSDFVSV